MISERQTRVESGYEAPRPGLTTGPASTRGLLAQAPSPSSVARDRAAALRALDIPNTPPEDVARATLDGVERGVDEIFPDAISQLLADGSRAGVAKGLEPQNAAMVQAEPTAA